ncbi:hypothetical protein NQ317_006047 [Molorchus minor]|uniref:Uncharacterized protein n=1 Tax=Molorchus minor TaxID=1323400 RepID=A0ABQ9K2Q4_9CUCU|nr:hypothetical protein NQ317_006047 [Molorchus minor]
MGHPAKERYILFYILLEMVNLVILTIFAILNISHYPFASMSAILIGCSFLWYGLYLMYKFYLEIRDYNSVQSGVIEISCNTHPDPLIGLPERAVDSTAVRQALLFGNPLNCGLQTTTDNNEINLATV